MSQLSQRETSKVNTILDPVPEGLVLLSTYIDNGLVV